MKRRFMAAVALTIALALGSATPALAAPSYSAGDRFERAVRAVAPEVFEGLAAPRGPKGTAGHSALQVEIAGVSVSLPVTGSATERLPSGRMLYAAGHGSSMVPFQKRDGSIQVVFSIGGPGTPGTHSFKVDAEGRFEILEAGHAMFYDNQGFRFGVAPPWAKDANGRSVPTHFEANGSTLVQVVDHRNRGFQYPIVADPWLGQDLFSATWLGSANGDVTVNLRKSLWGNYVHTPNVSGWAVMLTAGWEEAKAKQPTITSKQSLRQQYDCHVGGGYLTIAGDWNLERWRPDRYNEWFVNVGNHRCNWSGAGGEV